MNVAIAIACIVWPLVLITMVRQQGERQTKVDFLSIVIASLFVAALAFVFFLGIVLMLK